ncbi:MAG: hypothetical protein II276_02860 [Bacteroidales bacterium]|nr:hypothetical protein [Bacteroidales bacterium]
MSLIILSLLKKIGKMKFASSQKLIYIVPRCEWVAISNDARICDTSMEDYEVGEDQDVDW